MGTARHQCHIHEGMTSRHFAALAAEISRKLKENYRCLFFNSEPMLARLRLYLAAANVDVTSDHGTSLILSSELKHLDEKWDV